jgi:hypothetical protein
MVANTDSISRKASPPMEDDDIPRTLDALYRSFSGVDLDAVKHGFFVPASSWPLFLFRCPKAHRDFRTAQHDSGA